LHPFWQEMMQPVPGLGLNDSIPLGWMAGRARHSVRAVVVNPSALVSKTGGQGIARPTNF